MCYKYVTDISNLICLFTDLPYLFRINTIFVQYRLHDQALDSVTLPFPMHLDK